MPARLFLYSGAGEERGDLALVADEEEQDERLPLTRLAGPTASRNAISLLVTSAVNALPWLRLKASRLRRNASSSR